MSEEPLEELKKEIENQKKPRKYTKSDRSKQTMLQNLAKGRAIRQQRLQTKKQKLKIKDESESESESESDEMDFVIAPKKSKQKEKKHKRGGELDSVNSKIDELTRIMHYLATTTKKKAKNKSKPSKTVVQVMPQQAPAPAPAPPAQVKNLQDDLLKYLKY